MSSVRRNGGRDVDPVAVAVLFVCMGSVIGLVAILSRAVRADPIDALTIGKAAPGFTAPDLDGRIHTLEAYQGRPVIINFWATWCDPCRDEMPILQAAYEQHKDVKLAVLAISQDGKGKGSQESVRDYVADATLTLQVLLDPEGTVASHYQVLFLPSTVFVNADGVITGIHHGPVAAKQLEQYLTTLLSP